MHTIVIFIVGIKIIMQSVPFSSSYVQPALNGLLTSSAFL